MTKLNQLVAVENGKKTRTKTRLTELHHVSQKTALLEGINRTYEAKDEEGDRLPSESTRVQVRLNEVLKDVAETLTDLFDVTLTKEVGNTQAKADVVVDGKVLVKSAPVTYLLFLEKQLVDVRTFVSKLPVLNPAYRWEFNDQEGVWQTEPEKTVRTKKVPKAFVKAPATDKHPAQVEVFNEDVIVGQWTKVQTSGAVPAARRAELLTRVDNLLEAVKFAREEANSQEVTDKKTGKAVFDYLFA